MQKLNYSIILLLGLIIPVSAFAGKLRPIITDVADLCPAKNGQKVYFIGQYNLEIKNYNHEYEVTSSSVTDKNFGTVGCITVKANTVNLSSDIAKSAEAQQKIIFNNQRINSFSKVQSTSSLGQNSGGKPGSLYYLVRGNIILEDNAYKYLCENIIIGSGKRDFSGRDWWIYSNYPYETSAKSRYLRCIDITIPNNEKSADIEVKAVGNGDKSMFIQFIVQLG